MTAERIRHGVTASGASRSEGGRGGTTYVEEFEARLVALNPLPETRRSSKRLSTGGIELFAEKFTAAVFVAQYWTAEILIGRGQSRFTLPKIMTTYAPNMEYISDTIVVSS